MAFGIWYIEKEFHVGMIDDTFPLLKFLNLYDDYNLKKYESIMKREMNTGKTPRTIG